MGRTLRIRFSSARIAHLCKTLSSGSIRFRSKSTLQSTGTVEHSPKIAGFSRVTEISFDWGSRSFLYPVIGE